MILQSSLIEPIPSYTQGGINSGRSLMSRELKPDFYQILGVSQGAEEVVIRAAYRALVQRYHPDKVPAKERAQAQTRLLEIQEAYRILSDPAKRSEFDRAYRARSVKNGFVAPGKGVWEMPNTRFANPLDAQSWEALLHFHPQLTEHFSRLAKADPVMAKEYKSFLTELVAEKVMAKVVKRVSQDTMIKTVYDQESSPKSPSPKVRPQRLKKPT